MAETMIFELPGPEIGDDVPLNDLLRERRTIREYTLQALELQEISQLLWAAQGITTRKWGGLRTAPSAGALYPLELHLVASRVKGLPPGGYRYNPIRNQLVAGTMGELLPAIARAALNQDWITQAPAIILISAVFSRTTAKYGECGIRYVHIEVGHAGQNLLLQAVALGLGAATVGSFHDDDLRELLRLPEGEHSMVILTVGHPGEKISN